MGRIARFLEEQMGKIDIRKPLSWCQKCYRLNIQGQQAGFKNGSELKLLGMLFIPLTLPVSH